MDSQVLYVVSTKEYNTQMCVFTVFPTQALRARGLLEHVVYALKRRWIYTNWAAVNNICIYEYTSKLYAGQVDFVHVLCSASDLEDDRANLVHGVPPLKKRWIRKLMCCILLYLQHLQHFCIVFFCWKGHLKATIFSGKHGKFWKAFITETLNRRLKFQLAKFSEWLNLYPPSIILQSDLL